MYTVKRVLDNFGNTGNGCSVQSEDDCMCVCGGGGGAESEFEVEEAVKKFRAVSRN